MKLLKQRSGCSSFVLVLTVWLGLSATGAQAQLLEEIVVTASKRGAENIQDIPYNISALSNEALTRMAASNISDISHFVPGLSTVKDGAIDSTIVIRGLAQAELTAAQASIYVDEVPVIMQSDIVNSPNIGFYDLERVEVLRGPQGTLYGSSSQSGTVRFITRKPHTEKIEGYLATGIGTRAEDAGERLNFNGAINVPVIKDRFAVRVMGYYEDLDGRVDKPLIGMENTNKFDQWGVRASALFDISETTSLKGTYFRTRSKVADGDHVYPDTDVRANPVADTGLEPITDKLAYYSFTLDHAFDFGAFTGTVANFERDTVNVSDVSTFLPPGFNGGLFTPSIIDELSAELRFASAFDGPVQLIAGYYYNKSDTDFDENFSDGLLLDTATGLTLPNNGVPLIAGGNVFFQIRNKHTIKENAFFGEVTYSITARLKLLGGIRYYDFESDFSLDDILTPPGFPGVGVITAPTANEDGLVFKANASYDLTDDILLYLTYSEGFRSGRANIYAATIVALGGVAPDSYESDDVTNYELGWKTTLWNKQVVINGAVYHMQWDDIQIVSVAPPTVFAYVENAGKAKLYGVELESVIQPNALEGFSLGVNLRYSDQKLSEDQPPTAATAFPGRDGDDIPQTFDFEFSITADQRFPIMGLDGFVNMNASYMSEAKTKFRNDDPAQRRWGGVWLTGANLGVEAEKWSAVLYARNLFNERKPLEWHLTLPVRNTFVPTEPREAGIRFKYHF